MALNGNAVNEPLFPLTSSLLKFESYYVLQEKETINTEKEFPFWNSESTLNALPARHTQQQPCTGKVTDPLEEGEGRTTACLRGARPWSRPAQP